MRKGTLSLAMLLAATLFKISALDLVDACSLPLLMRSFRYLRAARKISIFCCLNVEVSVIATDLTHSEKLTIRYGWLITVRMRWAEDEVRMAIHGFVMYRSGYAISLRLHADIQERNREGKPSVICRWRLPVPQRLSTKHCCWLSITAYTVSSRLSRLCAMYVRGWGLVQLLLGSSRIWKNMYISVTTHGILIYLF